MRQLVQYGRAVAFSVVEGLKGGKLDAVECRCVEGSVGAVVDVCAGSLDEAVGCLDAPTDGKRLRGPRVEPLRKLLDLLDVEYSIGLEEGDVALDFLAGVVMSVRLKWSA